MPIERPNLTVAAQPISTFTAPVAAAAELYDQQTVNLALQFSEAFKDFSVTAANFASVLKKENNQQELQAGIDLVHKNQKSYAQLVETGEIKPSENPWLAVGAQQASGQIEGSKARAQFTALYNQQAEQDPSFFDNPDKFNVLAASYAENMAQNMSDAPYMSRAFFESLDPYVGSMRLKHEEQMVEVRNKKAMESLGGAVADAVENFSSADEQISSLAVPGLQEYMDNMGRNGFNQKAINLAVAEQLINQMESSDYPERAEKILSGLKAGTAGLVDVPAVKAALSQRRSKIEANRNRLTAEEARIVDDEFFGTDGVVDQIVSGRLTVEDGIKKWDDFTNSDARRVSVSPSYYEDIRKRIPSVVASRQAAQERELAIANHESILTMAVNLSNRVGAGLSDAEAYDRNLTDLTAEMERLNIPMSQRLQAEQIFESRWKDNAKGRALSALQESQYVLWNGVGQQPGILQQYSSEAANFMASTDRNLALPSLANFKFRIDTDLESRGMTKQNNPEAVKDAYANAQINFSKVLAQQEAGIINANPNFNGTLTPLDADTPDIRARKADVRTRQTLLKMQAGLYFENNTEASRLTNQFVTNLGIATTENKIPWQMEDTLRAFALARQNGLPVSTVVAPSPDSPVGKQMTDMLEWMTTQIETTGANPADVIKDAASRKFFQGTMGSGVDLFDMKNPLAVTNMGTSGADQREYEDNFSNTRRSLGVTNPDSSPIMLAAWRNAYLQTLQTTLSPRQALNEAENAVREKYVVVRGSLLPKMAIKDQTGHTFEMSKEYINVWLDQNFPGMKATLVAVALDPYGQPLMAVRDENGMSVPGSKGIYNPNDLAPTPQMIQKTLKAVREERSKSNEYRGMTSYHP